MAWKQTGHPTVQQRDKWVVRVDGIDTVSGARKPRQLGTYRSRRSARAAASAHAASGESRAERKHGWSRRRSLGGRQGRRVQHVVTPVRVGLPVMSGPVSAVCGSTASIGTTSGASSRNGPMSATGTPTTNAGTRMTGSSTSTITTDPTDHSSGRHPSTPSPAAPRTTSPQSTARCRRCGAGRARLGPLRPGVSAGLRWRRSLRRDRSGLPSPRPRVACRPGRARA